MIINVKEITDNDLVSPIGGKLLGEKIVSIFNGTVIELDFVNTGSHTSLFFNAMLNELLSISDLSIDKTIKIINSTELDKDTFKICKDNFEQKMSLR